MDLTFDQFSNIYLRSSPPQDFYEGIPITSFKDDPLPDNWDWTEKFNQEKWPVKNQG